LISGGSQPQLVTTPLLELPTEPHIELLSLLSYQSPINLAKTNRHFASLPTPQTVWQVLLNFENLSVCEWKARFEAAHEYSTSVSTAPNRTTVGTLVSLWCKVSCYECLRLLRRKKDFHLFYKTRVSDLDGKLASGRRCTSCVVKRIEKVSRVDKTSAAVGGATSADL
jgi:hypothetical protein